MTATREPVTDEFRAWLTGLSPRDAALIQLADGEVPLPDGRRVRYRELSNRDMAAIRAALALHHSTRD